VAIIIQQHTTIYSLFISVNCSTCFEWYLHPSSGAHIHSLYSTWHYWNFYCYLSWTWLDGNRSPFYINKLYIVASCWIAIATEITFFVCEQALNFASSLA